MKVWCVPVNFPNPEKDPEQAESALKFIYNLNGLKGISMHETGIMMLTFIEKEDARAAKWKLEEFCPVKLEIIEGTTDGRTLNLNRLLKGE